MAGLVQKFKDMWNPGWRRSGLCRWSAGRHLVWWGGTYYIWYTAAGPSSSNVSANKVVNIRTATARTEVVLFKPEHFGEETRTVADELFKDTVVLNLENTSKDVSRRIIDFLSGVAYATVEKSNVLQPVHLSLRHICRSHGRWCAGRVEKQWRLFLMNESNSF